MRDRLDDLEALPAAQQVEKGKAVLAALDTTVRFHPVGDRLEVEITGKVEGILALLAATRPEGQKRWLKIIKDLRTALKENP